MSYGTVNTMKRCTHLHERWLKAHAGFTLVELLVGSVLVLIAAAGAALVVSSSSNTLRSARTIDRLEAQLDDNVAAVRELATRFSCCSGACGLGVVGCFPDSGPGDDRFYYPEVIDGNDPGFLEFTRNIAPTPNTLGLCENGGIGNAFLGLIDANVPQPIGVVRQPPQRVNAADGRNHAVRLNYVGPANTGVSRIVDIVPPAAAWCPL